MKKNVSIFTGMHFLVDLLCIYRLYAIGGARLAGGNRWLVMAVLYNFLAFALPAFIGLVADILDTGEKLAALGCILTAMPSFLPGDFVWLMVVLQGIGNGCFHVGAGRRVLLDSGKSYAPSGVFICSGAMGVFLGTFWRGAYRPVLLYGVGALLLLSAVILLIMGAMHKKHTVAPNAAFSENAVLPENQSNPKQSFLSLAVIMLLFVVILRSFYGTVMEYDWKNTFQLKLIFTLCIVAGKGLGGIIADRIGVKLTAILSLGGAAVTVLLSANSPVLGCISILLFNMTMPLTLSLLAEYWKEYPGMAFGVLMLGLFIGTLPTAVVPGLALSMQALFVVCLLSLLGLLIGIGKEKREKV